MVVAWVPVRTSSVPSACWMYQSMLAMAPSVSVEAEASRASWSPSRVRVKEPVGRGTPHAGLPLPALPRMRWSWTLEIGSVRRARLSALRHSHAQPPRPAPDGRRRRVGPPT